LALNCGTLRGRDAGEGVHIARQQGGHLRGRVGDEAEGGPLDLDGLALR
jgi:hypothetical protein